jgi:hypothetical protein
MHSIFKPTKQTRRIFFVDQRLEYKEYRKAVILIGRFVIRR